MRLRRQTLIGLKFHQRLSLSLSYGYDKDRYHDDEVNALANELNQAYSANNAAQQALSNIISNIAAPAIFNTQEYRVENIIATARWDFHKQAAMKFEYGQKQHGVPDANSDEKPKIFLIGIDLVFYRRCYYENHLSHANDQLHQSMLNRYSLGRHCCYC